MIRIYQYSEIKDVYFIKEGSNVVKFDSRSKVIEKGRGLRIQLFFLNFSVKKLQRGTKEYNKVLDEYENMLARLPLPYRYDAKEADNKENRSMEQNEFRITPYMDCA